MSELTVRAYNVLFGDAVLVSIPEATADGGEVTRHLLIDVGNLLASRDQVFRTVVADIAQRTGGVVDLYVMTHEHLDHVQGLLAAKRAGIDLAARYAWLTGSAAPGYYDQHDEARRRRLDDARLFRSLVAQHDADSDPWLETMIVNNSVLLPEGALGLSTADYVDHVRGIAPAEHTHYVDRSTDLAGKHPFAETALRVLAPEEDTSTYYGRRRPAALFAAAPEEGPAARPDARDAARPPVGVDAGAFFDLVRARRRLNRQAILEIDAAANNTSIVLELTWRGWTLLFTGDAEERSWETMREGGLLAPQHFVKVSHHGSCNGTVEEVLDVLFPATAADGRPRRALVSTHDDDWDTVPSTTTLGQYRSRCELLDTRQVAEGEAVVVTFPG